MVYTTPHDWSVSQPLLNHPLAVSQPFLGVPEPKTAGYIQFLYKMAILSHFCLFLVFKRYRCFARLRTLETN
jgi:hypothetical protein